MSTTGQHPVTKLFVDFVAHAKPSVLTPTLVEQLKLYLLDYFGVTIAAANAWESTEQILQGILALGAHGGISTVVLKGQKFLPQYAGLLNATYGHSMDFDDTYAAGSLHAGVCAISAALTQAELSEKGTVEQFMLAAAVGYEVICRLGKELGPDAYARGFHNTATAGIFGAVASIAVLKQLPAAIVESAFGLALSKAAGSMQYLENGSWNKRLHPGFAVHDAFICVSLAEAGVLGSSRAIEGKYGLFHAYSPKEKHDWSHLASELGKRWDFLETALKPYPACRMTHGLIEVGGRSGDLWRHRTIEKMTVSLSPMNIIVVGARVPNKVHPKNLVDAQFSAYFQLAHAWLYGSNTGVQFSDRLEDEDIWSLSDRIVCVEDPTVTAMGSKLHIQFTDGQSERFDIPHPLGEPEHPYSKSQIEDKYFGLVTPAVGQSKALAVQELVEELENHSVAKLLKVVSGEP